MPKLESLKLSLFVVNQRPPADKFQQDKSYIFQVRLELEYEGGFVTRSIQRDDQYVSSELFVLAALDDSSPLGSIFEPGLQAVVREMLQMMGRRVHIGLAVAHLTAQK